MEEKENLRQPGTPGWLRVGCFVCGLAVILVLAYLAFKTLSVVENVAGKPGEVLDSAKDLAKAFKTGTIKTEFLSYATKVQGSRRLQVAEVETTEVFYKKDSKAYFWDLVPLPDVEVEIRMPVTYTYYVDLDEEWKLVLEGRTLNVHVPEIHFNAPAPDISRMEIREKSSVLRLVEDDLKNQILGGVTEELKKRAETNVDNLNLYATAGESVEEFVKTWFAGALKSYGVKDPETYHIEIHFPERKSPPSKIEPKLSRAVFDRQEGGRPGSIHQRH